MNLEGAADSASRFADYVEGLMSVIGHAGRVPSGMWLELARRNLQAT
jgi:hypothetical protein